MTNTEKDMIIHSEEAIRAAFKNTWAAATNQEVKAPLMSIPPRPDKDADFILSDAIDELMIRRTAPRDGVDREILGRLFDEAVQWSVNSHFAKRRTRDEVIDQFLASQAKGAGK